MSFINTIADMCAVDLACCEFRLTALGSNCIYIEGVKRVRGYSQTEVVLCLKKSEISIKGNGLKLEKYCGEDLLIKGCVKSVERFCI